MIGLVKGGGAGRARHQRHRVVAALTTVTLLLSPALAGRGDAQTVSRSAAVPRITGTTLSRRAIPAAGGTTTLRIVVRDAETCWFEGMPGLVISSAHQNCARGTAKATARIGASDSVVLAHLHIGVSAAGAGGKIATATVYLVQAGLAAVRMTTQSLRPAAVGKRYSAQLGARGGRSPYSWRLAAGELPVGLSLSPGGLLSGIPTMSGSFPISLQVSDASRPQPVTSAVQLTLTIVPARLKVTTRALPAAAVPSIYSATLAVAGGVAPYNWRSVSGQLPPGLSLAPTGALSGTPTAGGTFRFGAQVTDSGQPPQILTVEYTLRVTETPIIDKTPSLPGATVGAPPPLRPTAGSPRTTGPFLWDNCRTV